MDSSSSDEPIKYAPNRLGIALIAAGVIGLVLSVYAIYAMGHWQGIWVYIAIFAFFHQNRLCTFCAKPYFGSDYSASNLGLSLFRSREIFHDGQYEARDVRELICTLSEIKTGWGNHSNGTKTAFGNPHASLSRLRRMMVERTHVSEIVLTEHGQLRLSAWRQNGQRILWSIEEISQDVAEQAYPATIPALTVSESGTISHMNAVARALLGTRVNRFSMLVNAGELTWNAPNTIETNRGKERYFLVPF